jgi:hypothetical protein
VNFTIRLEWISTRAVSFVSMAAYARMPRAALAGTRAWLLPGTVDEVRRRFHAPHPN